MLIVVNPHVELRILTCRSTSGTQTRPLSTRRIHSRYVPATLERASSSTRCNLFRQFFGGAPKSPAEPSAPVEYVEAEDLPFPMDILDTTFLRGRRLARAYRASADGWSARDFHSRCDMKGPAVVVAWTVDGCRFGGFNPEGFKSSDDYDASFDAFLFCWPQSAPDQCIKLEKVGGPEAALFDYARGGPQWGADGLLIGPPKSPVMGGMAGPEVEGTGLGDLRVAKSRLGLAYAKIPEEYGQVSLFGGDAKTATLAELEVYYAPELAALY